jgi:hypothetical protein
MSRRNSIIIIAIVGLLIIGGLIFMFSNSANKNALQNATSTGNLFGNTPGNKVPGSTNIQTNNPSGNNQPANTKANLAELIQLYKNPTSGSVFFVNKGAQNVLRFVDRANGNVYEYIPITQTGIATRITNTTIPKIQEVVWSNTGNSLIYRYLDDTTNAITSFSANIKTSTSSDSLGNVTGSFLASNIKQLATNLTGNKLFGLVDKSDRSGTLGFTANTDGSGKKTVLDSPISYWNISWPKDNVITLTTKPNGSSNGLLFFFNPSTYSMDRILGNFPGMSTVTNNTASLVAYSYTIPNSFSLDVYDVANKISKGLKISTFADKCVWGNSNPRILYCAIPQAIFADTYPDAWYQGTKSFNDNIWKIDIDTGVTTEIYKTSSSANENIDGYNFEISADDQYLSFMNKNDLSLWLLKITK